MSLKKDSYYKELESKGYYDNIDKRTKDYREYKDWLSKNTEANYDVLRKNVEEENAIGLGDVVEKVAEKTGVKKIVDVLSDALGVDCGCDERKEKFNMLGKWRRKKVNCISESDYNWIKDYIKNGKGKYTYEQRVRIVSIHNNIFNTRHKTSNCSPCMNGFMRNIEDYLNIWENEDNS